jgi:hypothetical protein
MNEVTELKSVVLESLLRIVGSKVRSNPRLTTKRVTAAMYIADRTIECPFSFTTRVTYSEECTMRSSIGQIIGNRGYKIQNLMTTDPHMDSGITVPGGFYLRLINK